MNGLTNATLQDVAWCPKHQTAKWCCGFDGHCLTRPRFTENLSIYLSPAAPNSPLQNPSNFGATASHWLLYFLLFFFFLIFNRSLIRGDEFIHFVSGSRRVNIRLGVLLLIPKSPQVTPHLPKLQNWSLTIKRFSAVSWRLLLQRFSRYILRVELCMWNDQVNVCVHTWVYTCVSY